MKVVAILAGLIGAIVIGNAPAIISEACADAPDTKGQPRATEQKTTGKPDNPDGWGSVVSDFGRAGIMGPHASAFPSPRDGLGNVARNDGELGDDMGSHGEFAARMSRGIADATDKPGR